MRTIILNEDGTNKTLTFETTFPDLPDFNKEMLNAGFEAIDSFEVISKGKTIKVDLVNVKISVDNIDVNLELKEEEITKLKAGLLKWINFRRNTISRRMNGNESRVTKYGIGFQGNVDGRNVKRYILVSRDSVQLIKE